MFPKMTLPQNSAVILNQVSLKNKKVIALLSSHIQVKDVTVKISIICITTTVAPDAANSFLSFLESNSNRTGVKVGDRAPPHPVLVWVSATASQILRQVSQSLLSQTESCSTVSLWESTTGHRHHQPVFPHLSHTGALRPKCQSQETLVV